VPELEELNKLEERKAEGKNETLVSSPKMPSQAGTKTPEKKVDKSAVMNLVETRDKIIREKEYKMRYDKCVARRY